MMRRLLFLSLALSFAAVFGAAAQSLDAFKRQLAEPAAAPGLLFGRAQVIAVEYGDAGRTVAEASRAERRDRFPGYRVCIFSDNGPEARNGAFAAQKLFEETYPGVKVYMDYKIPYFVVSVGDCLSNEEAVILKGRVTGTFPKAFLKNEEFPISNLLD